MPALTEFEQRRRKARLELVESKKGKKLACRHCGTPTYNPDGVCALCRTGITELYKELQSLKK